MHYWFWRTHFVYPQGQFFFSRNPVSFHGEAIYVKENSWDLREAYELALLASGFNQSNGAFRPCPLGTFTNPLTKGVDGCVNCLPGKF